MRILTDTAGCCPDFDLSALAPLEEILFFDIETTGLRKESTQVYLIGCAFYEPEETGCVLSASDSEKNGESEGGTGCWKIRQFLAESALDEQLILEAFAAFAARFRTLVHFNGDGFDIPYLAYKAEYYCLDFSFDRFRSIDIYLLSKPLKKLLGLSNLKQKTIEAFLRIGREDLYSGGALIPVYYEFERTGSEEALSLLLLHNFEDVEGMLQIVSILDYLQIPEGRFSFDRFEIAGKTVILEYRLLRPVAVSFETRLESDRTIVCADGALLQLSIDLYEGEARLPLPDVENYFYLPEEDRVIHRDVAAFVDRAHRRKATKKNCFLRKEGRFLPQRRSLFTPAFEVEGERRKTFFEVPDSLPDDPARFTQYALDILNC